MMDKKAGLGVLMAAGMAMASSMESERWGRSRKTMANFRPNKKANKKKKADRKAKQASQRKNRK